MTWITLSCRKKGKILVGHLLIFRLKERQTVLPYLHKGCCGKEEQFASSFLHCAAPICWAILNSKPIVRINGRSVSIVFIPWITGTRALWLPLALFPASGSQHPSLTSTTNAMLEAKLRQLLLLLLFKCVNPSGSRLHSNNPPGEKLHYISAPEASLSCKFTWAQHPIKTSRHYRWLLSPSWIGSREKHRKQSSGALALQAQKISSALVH